MRSPRRFIELWRTGEQSGGGQPRAVDLAIVGLCTELASMESAWPAREGTSPAHGSADSALTLPIIEPRQRARERSGRPAESPVHIAPILFYKTYSNRINYYCYTDDCPARQEKPRLHGLGLAHEPSFIDFARRQTIVGVGRPAASKRTIGKRSARILSFAFFDGGRTRARTLDPLIKSSAALPTELCAHRKLRP